MKKLQVIMIVFFAFLAVNTYSQASTAPIKKINTNDYVYFGEKFKVKQVLSEKGMLKKYQNLKKGDTINITFTSKIKEVCKKKGCWMSLDLTKNQTSFVRFQDYGFFVPLNADGSQTIVHGKAYIDVVSVEELRHYAKDAKKSEDEINKITKPKVTYAFLATGVMIKKS